MVSPTIMLATLAAELAAFYPIREALGTEIATIKTKTKKGVDVSLKVTPMLGVFGLAVYSSYEIAAEAEDLAKGIKRVGEIPAGALDIWRRLSAGAPLPWPDLPLPKVPEIPPPF